jgi:phage-related protein
MPFDIEYYNSKVLAEIESWPADFLADYARLVELLIAHGPNLRLPHSRSMKKGLFELRPRGASGISRAFYCFAENRRIVVLHAFVKKTQETPPKELRLARKRAKELKDART